MIYIDNKYAFIKFTNIYQNNHNFSYFFTTTSHVTGSIIELRSSAVAITAHFDTSCSIIILRQNL